MSAHRHAWDYAEMRITLKATGPFPQMRECSECHEPDVVMVCAPGVPCGKCSNPGCSCSCHASARSPRTIKIDR